MENETYGSRLDTIDLLPYFVIKIDLIPIEFAPKMSVCNVSPTIPILDMSIEEPVIN